MIFARCLAYLTVVKLSLQLPAPLERPIFQLSVLCHEIQRLVVKLPFKSRPFFRMADISFVCFSVTVMTFSDRKIYLYIKIF